MLVYEPLNYMLFTPPEINPHIITNYNSFTIGSYVKVRKDYISGFNISSGCGYVKQISKNLFDVKYTPVYNSGRLHKNIPTSKAIVTIFHHDMTIPTEDR